MELLDVFALSGLEWVYDRVEERFGKLAAWVVTLGLGLAIMALAVAFIVHLF